MGEVQYLDVKYLIDLEAEYKEEVKRHISLFRSCQETEVKSRDPRIVMFSETQGRAIKNALDDYLSVYLTVRAERMFLRDVYVGQLKKGRP